MRENEFETRTGRHAAPANGETPNDLPVDDFDAADFEEPDIYSGLDELAEPAGAGAVPPRTERSDAAGATPVTATPAADQGGDPVVVDGPDAPVGEAGSELAAENEERRLVPLIAIAIGALAIVVALILGITQMTSNNAAQPVWTGSSADPDAMTSATTASTEASTGGTPEVIPEPMPVATSDGASAASGQGGAVGVAPDPGQAAGAVAGAGADGSWSADDIEGLVNKRNPISPIDYVPSDLVAMSDIGVPSANGHSLRAPAAEAIRQMFADARSQAGIEFDMTSGYRSYELQTTLYNGYVSELGQQGADATSARPGHSEHQMGLAADISSPADGCVLEQCYANTKGGQWLKENAWKYGFILRYPEGLTPITGYEYEPWHYRYVGKDVAARYQQSGAQTYEEFLGVPASPDYV